ncbi:MAG: type II secretion system F family protein [Alcaligenaceae bacterium]|nr:type II secretion system F family protein [Alcaligenaceae bacterium]
MLWISSFAAGLCLALVARVVLGPWARRVPACPWLLSPGSPLRLIWLWVCCLAPALEPMLSWRYRARLETLLRTAGLDRHWLPVHVLACQVLAGWVLLAPSAIFVFLLGLSPVSGLVVLVFVFTGASLGVAGQFKRLGQLRQAAMLRELPFMLDMTTLCVRAGLNLQGALEQSARHCPPGPLRAELERALGDMRTGVSRLQALSDMAQRSQLDEVSALVNALRQADQLGMNLGPLLQAQSSQRRVELFQRAEKLAMQAPVKMLFPLVFCIFPCTFLIIGFPVVIRLLAWG